MNSLAIVAFFAALAATDAGVIQGPSTRSIVAGPDGSVISSAAPGGQIVTEEHPGVIGHAAPVLAYSAYSAHSAPVVSAYSGPVLSAYSAPVLTAYSAPVVSAYSAHAVPTVYAGGVVAHNAVDAVVTGPSGTIATSRNVAGPAVYGHGIRGLYY